MESFTEKIDREIKEIEEEFTLIPLIVNEILRIQNISSFDFDYDSERKHLMYVNVKNILDVLFTTVRNYYKEPNHNARKEIIEYINSRIKYFSDGDEMKSLNESIADERVVKELNKMKEKINLIYRKQKWTQKKK